MRIQAENGWRVSEECYLIEEDETEEAEEDWLCSDMGESRSTEWPAARCGSWEEEGLLAGQDWMQVTQELKQLRFSHEHPHPQAE